MAMKPLHSDRPYGEYDGLDTEVGNLLGGEVVGFTAISITATDQAASDVSDGYAGTSSKNRPVVTKTLVTGMRPLFLADEGIAGYGTSLGSVVGSATGKLVTGGTVLGPHTALGSGKVTLWDTVGLYAITLDAVDTTATTGLVPGTNTGLNPAVPLWATSAGKLTPSAGSAFESFKVGTFIDFISNQSLVTTPATLVAALNSPSSNLSSIKANSFTQAVVHFTAGGSA